MQAKLDASRRSIELLHPGHGKDLAKPDLHQLGTHPLQPRLVDQLRTGTTRRRSQTLQTPDRRVYFAGDHTSHLVGWQEGAALSAYRVIRQLGARIESAG